MNYFKIKAKVWLYPGMAGWHFLSVPKTTSRKIKKLFGDMAGGWGSLPVKVSIKETVWKTSIFPDKKSGEYLLPLKAEVRKKQGIKAGDAVVFSIEIKI